MTEEQQQEEAVDVDEQQEAPEPESEEQTEQEPTGEEDDDRQPSVETADEGILISIDGEEDLEPPPEADNTVLRDMRHRISDMKRQNRKLREKIEELNQQYNPPQATTELGKRPTLESCDYDEALFQKKNDEYNERLLAQMEREREQKAAQQRSNQQWQERLNNYAVKRESLEVPDFKEAEMRVEDILSPTQQGLIVDGADDPALVVYALGKNPKKLKELAAIKHPVRFSFAAAKLENKLKVTKRKTKTAPEKKVTGSLSSKSVVEDTLERLREKAAKTDDYTELLKYKNKLRRKASQ